MGFLERFQAAGTSRAAPQAYGSAAQLADALDAALDGPRAAGVPVTPRSAMMQTTVFVAVRVISETMAQLPLVVVRKRRDGGSDPVTDHPVAQLLGDGGQPNAFQTPFEMVEFLTRHAALGNGYAFVNRVDGGRRVQELLPVHPRRMTVRMDDAWGVTYKIGVQQGVPIEVGPENMLHLRGPSDVGYVGDDLVRMHADAIGLGLAQDRSAARMFANGARLPGFLKSAKPLDPDAVKKLRDQFQDLYGGAENAGKTPVLEDGLDWVKASMTGDEAQLAESRGLQRSIIAAIWRVPPHLVGDLSKATFSNIENMARQFVDFGLMPWVLRAEQALGTQLLTEAERRTGLRINLDEQALLRGDLAARTAYYTAMRTAEVLSPNDVRRAEGLNPREGGDNYDNPNTKSAPGSGAGGSATR
jgi:HK97 family phage portal protein